MRRLSLPLIALVFGLPALALADPDPPAPPADPREPTPQEPIGAELPADVMDAARLAYHSQPWTPRISQPGEGALSGRSIALSPGHGIVYDEGWGFQRGITQGLREDLSNAQWMNDYLIEMVERAGGTVVNLRERSYGEHQVVVDNDADTGGAYVETGAWQTGSSDGYGGTYRYMFRDEAGSGVASWSFTVEETGEQPIYVSFLSGDNRTDAAAYTVSHASGDETVVVAQNTLRVENAAYASYPNNPPASDAVRAPSQIWQYLGTFPFAAGERYTVTLSNQGADTDRVVIADAIHVGGGMGTVLGGGEVSGRPRWEESASTFLSWTGAPSWTEVGDVSQRPLYAIYRGVDAYVSIHTNCCESSGTSTYTWYPEMWVREAYWPEGFAENELPPGTHEMATMMHDQVIAHVRAHWQDDWPDQGRLGANFGELRALRNGWYEDVHTHGIADPMTIPSMLIEVGYHDTAHDAALIRETRFRRDVARGMLVGLIRFFEGPDAEVPPLAPEKLWTVVTDDGLEVHWEPQIDEVTGAGNPTRYHVYTSRDGVLFDTIPVETADTRVTLALDGCEPLYVRVSAVNEAGASLDSPVVGGQRAREGGAEVLVIDGVEREVKLASDPNNLRSYARIWGPAIAAALPGAGFTMATDEAPRTGDHDAWVWMLGETSTRFGTLDATQQADVAAALAAGVPVILSGAELGWDLVERGDADDVAFFADVLGVTYAGDDAEQTQVDGSGLGLGTIAFGTCEADTVCVEYPDVLTVEDGDTALMAYTGGAGDAVVLSETGAVVAGFPLEAIAEEGREEVLAAILARVLDPALASDGSCEPETGEDTGMDVGPEDTGATDTGAGDTGVADTGAADTGTADTAVEPDVDGDDTAVADSGAADTEADTASALSSAQSSTGCGCTSTPQRSQWAWVVALGAWVWRRRRATADVTEKG